MVKSPVPVFSLIGVYLYFVLSWGPKYMKDRKAFKLEKTLMLYNFIQVALSVWMVYDVSLIEHTFKGRLYNWYKTMQFLSGR